MPTTNPTGRETYTPFFDVEPSYATGHDAVFLFMRQQDFDGPQHVFQLPITVARELAAALTKCIGKE